MGLAGLLFLSFSGLSPMLVLSSVCIVLDVSSTDRLSLSSSGLIDLYAFKLSLFSSVENERKCTCLVYASYLLAETSVSVICSGVYEVCEVGVGVGEHRGCPGVVHRGAETLWRLPKTLDDERPDRRAVWKHGQGQRGLQPRGEAVKGFGRGFVLVFY